MEVGVREGGVGGGRGALCACAPLRPQQNRFTHHLDCWTAQVKNMKNLGSLWLSSNRITAIFPGDFAGAKQLVDLNLGGNRITFAAREAFHNLAAFRVDPKDFNPTNDDGTPFLNSHGVGLWPHTGVGPFDSSASQDWATLPIAFTPNPVQCLWTGPLVSDFNCSHCVLGYVRHCTPVVGQWGKSNNRVCVCTAAPTSRSQENHASAICGFCLLPRYEAMSDDDATCTKPEFRQVSHGQCTPSPSHRKKCGARSFSRAARARGQN